MIAGTNQLPGINMAAQKKTDRWKIKRISVSSLDIDLDNPRIPTAIERSPESVYKWLFENESVSDLVKQIVDYGGLHEHEQIVVIEINGRFIAIEGNRRTCALLLISAPSRLPAELTTKVTVRIPNELVNKLQHVDVVIAPNRDVASELIAKLHTTQSKKPWSPFAKMRYAHDLHEKMATVEGIASYISEKPAEIRRKLRRYGILTYLEKLALSEKERKQLGSGKLKVTSYIRIFESQPVAKLIGVIFDSDGNVASKMPKTILNKSLVQMARDFIFPDDSGVVKFNSRSDLSDYISTHHPELVEHYRGTLSPAKGPKLETKAVHDTNKIDGKVVQFPAQPQQTNTPVVTGKLPKRRRFFDGIVVGPNCSKKLSNLVRELATIDVVNFPLGASLLLRSALEVSLRDLVKVNSKWTIFDSKFRERSLANLITFAADKSSGLFTDDSPRRQLQNAQGARIKNILNEIVHCNQFDTNEANAFMIGDFLRPTIEYVSSK